MKVKAWAASDVGMQRTVNEDCYYLDPDCGIVVVLDGMGGHRAGEVASRLAMETIVSFYKTYGCPAPNAPCGPDPEACADRLESYDPSFSYRSNVLRQAAFVANRVVLEHSLANEDLVGMGSTVAAMAVHEFTVSMINVGDSRLYLIRSGTIEQISRDHTLAEDQVERGLMSREEAKESQLRHILSSVIGVDSRIRVHMDEITVFPGDVFLLCSDGLTAVMADEEMLDEITKNGPGVETLQHLIDEVNRRGGPDNVTLALTLMCEENELPLEGSEDSSGAS